MRVDVKNVTLICSLLVLPFASRGQTITVTATPSTVSVSYQIGNALPAAIGISLKVSSGTPAFTTAVNTPNSLWLTASPDSGALPATLSLRINPTSLSAGIYQAAITLTVAGAAAPLNLPLKLT
jgi:hypothetical protein